MMLHQSRLPETDAVEKDGAVIEAIHLQNGQRISGKVSAKVVGIRMRLAHILRFSWKQATKATF